jgi:hypothetical protein
MYEILVVEDATMQLLLWLHTLKVITEGIFTHTRLVVIEIVGAIRVHSIRGYTVNKFVELRKKLIILLSTAL